MIQFFVGVALATKLVNGNKKPTISIMKPQALSFFSRLKPLLQRAMIRFFVGVALATKLVNGNKKPTISILKPLALNFFAAKAAPTKS
jgi:hypothetical protein